MKIFTKNLILFSVSLFLLTVSFRYLLSTLLQNQSFSYAIILSVAYGVIIFFISLFFAKRDKSDLPWYDVGFRFHLATYIVCNLVAECWFVLRLQSDYEKVKAIHLTVFIWGFGLCIHFIYFLITRKNTINGIRKSEIFE